MTKDEKIKRLANAKQELMDIAESASEALQTVRDAIEAVGEHNAKLTGKLIEYGFIVDAIIRDNKGVKG